MVMMRKFWNNHSTKVILGSATVSILSTTVFAVRAGYLVNDILKEEGLEDAHWKDQLKVTWKAYIPTAISLCATIASTFYLHRVGENRIAAVTSAAAITDRMFREYVAKVEEKLEPEVVQAIKDEIAQDHYDADYAAGEYIPTPDGELFRDGFSGRYFDSTVEEIREAVNSLNKDMLHCGYASLTDYYDLIGLPATTISCSIGWNTDNLVEVSFANIVTEGGAPCTEVVFHRNPDARFNKPF